MASQHFTVNDVQLAMEDGLMPALRSRAGRGERQL
jgi:hypothetical protein